MPYSEKLAARMVAHRGLFGRETENTCAAFIAAANRSFFAIETDVRKTADDIFVVSHDNNLARVCGENITIEDNTLEVLQSIVLYDINGGKSRSDLRLCTLDNYLDICGQYEKYCVLELKAYFTSEELQALVAKIESHSYLDKVMFSSFHYDDLVKLRKILPHAKIQLLIKEFSDETLEKVIAAKMDVAVSSKILTEDMVTLCHNKGVEVTAWIVNDRETAERFTTWGVEYIITNCLE